MSGAIDESTRRSIDSGRKTVGAMLSAAQSDLQKVFIVVVLGLVGTIWALREFLWDMLKRDLFAGMDPMIRESTEVVAITPFDVILLQVKIGIVVGILLGIPVFVWFSRDALRARGYWPAQRVPRWKLAIIAALSVVLLLGGISYAYFLFFPLMFDFLATNAVQVGFEPTYSIVKWAQFVFLLMVSFGLAAQLPLIMSALTYAGIVQYETFRDNWRYAILGIFAFGALFSPPDPFTQIMWAAPLIILYLFSLQLAKIAVLARRGSAQLDVPGVVRDSWNVLAGVTFLVGVAVYGFFTRAGVETINHGLTALPAGIRPAPLPTLSAATGLEPELAAGLVAAALAAVAFVVALLYFVSAELAAIDAAKSPAPASVGDPEDIDLDDLDVDGVLAAPPEAFETLSEDEALAKAQQAMDAENPGKAEAILNRFDEAQERMQAREGDGEAAGDGEAEAAQTPAEGEPTDEPTGEAVADEGGEGGRSAAETTAGMLNAFTAEETTEEDIGGYYYDVAFILESLTSKAFRLVAVFMAVLGGTFVWLYRGGIRRVKETFFGQMPQALQPDVDIVTLHPVEALIFEIKFSTLLAVVATLPLVLYYAWPALKERGLVRGDARVMLVWGGSLIVGIVGGSLLGFLSVAPSVISWLAADAIQSNMVIAYRINNFGWLVVYTTVGIGLLVEIPVSMLLFHLGGIVPYYTMVKYWREVVVALFAIGAFFSPRGVFTMLLIAVPAALMYLVGLGLLWLATVGGRRGRPDPVQPSPE